MVDIALFAWFPLALFAFQLLPKHRACILVVIAGELFLPEVDLFKMVPDAPDAKVYLVLKFTKANVIAISALFGAMATDFKHLRTFRPRWLDLPMFCFCIAPFFSGVTSGKDTLYDSAMAARDQSMAWGLPYFLGRLYLTDADKFRDLAIGLVIGGLVYVPFCVYETKMAPQFHSRLYGYHPSDFAESQRDGGNRPMVFMRHSLAVGLWLVATTITAIWLWWTKSLTHLQLPVRRKPIPMVWVLLLMLGTTAVCKAVGALALGVLGLVCLLATRWLRWPIGLIVLIAIPPTYIYTRSSGVWHAQDFALWVKSFKEERGNSLWYRFYNEDLVLNNIRQKPLFGYGGWGRAAKLVQHSRVDPDKAVTDGLWIVITGDNGYFALVSLVLVVLLPAVRLLWLYPQRLWSQPSYASAVVLAVVLIVYMIDSLSNAMVNPVFMLVAGGLIQWTPAAVQVPAPQLPAATQQRLPVIRPAPLPPAAPRPGVLARRRPFSS